MDDPAERSETVGRADVGSVSAAVGSRIRSERRSAGLTVRGLAARTGLSPSLISQVERGRATPSVATLFAIAAELGLSVGDLFNSETELPARNGGQAALSPVQPHETRRAITLETGVRWERLTAAVDDEVDFVHMVYPVGSASCAEDALMRHGGREFGYVLCGTLGVRVGFEEFVLRANDSISFDSSTPHRLWAIGDEPARAIWMVINRRGDPRAKSLS
jgi:transcriptional regulator with XRE-family HTH domain